MPALSVEELWQLYEDDPNAFAKEIGTLFGHESPGDFATEYGMYFTGFDPTGTQFADIERQSDIDQAWDIYELAEEKTAQVYETGIGDIRSTLGEEMEEYRGIVGGIGLRSGRVENVMEDYIASTGSKAANLSEAYMLDKEEDITDYESTVVDSTLDFQKSEWQEKQAWYDKIMQQVDRLSQRGVFDPEPRDDVIVTSLQENLFSFAEDYQDCAGYCGEDSVCMYDCAARAAEGSEVLDEFFHTPYENVYAEMGETAGIGEDEGVILLDTLETLAQGDTGIVHDLSLIHI